MSCARIRLTCRGSRFVVVPIALLAFGATLACGSTGSAPPMFASLDLPVTTTEFYIRANDFADIFVAVLEEGMERVIDQSSDEVIRRRAMEFRLRGLSGFLNALSKPDPEAALVDAWVYCLQLDQFVRPGGRGETYFGDHQGIVRTTTGLLAGEAEQLVIALTRSDPSDARDMVEQFVADNPITTPLLARESSTVDLADDLERGGSNIFAALGRLEAGVDDIAAQSQRYISLMPRTIRWHTQLILHETLYDELDLGEARVAFETMSDDFIELSRMAEELYAELPDREELMTELDRALDDLRSAIEVERARVLEEIDRQRGLIFGDVTEQRAAVMRDIEAQILMVDGQAQRHLDETLSRVEALTETAIRQSFAESERLVELVFYRTLIIVLVLLAGGAGLIVLNKSRRGAGA